MTRLIEITTCAQCPHVIRLGAWLCGETGDDLQNPETEIPADCPLPQKEQRNGQKTQTEKGNPSARTA